MAHKKFNRHPTIGDMQTLAEQSRGQCLSREYRGAYGRLTWQCAVGHKWETTPNEIRRGTWCPTCARNARRKYDLTYMSKLIRKRGGRLLSKNYLGLRDKLHVLCRQGHAWKASPRDLIYSKSWCPQCGAIRRGAGKRLEIEAMRRVAREREGQCLSRTYTRNSEKLRWRCKEGHEWEATPRDVMHSKSWCPTCGGSLLLSIEAMRDIAEQQRGECLSAKYRNSHTPLLWRCEFGHVWRAKPYFIKQGGWCPTCSIKKRSDARRHDISAMQLLAQTRGGLCLSTEYKGSAKKLRWSCANGHEWEATPNQNQRGSWCPRCSPGYGERVCRCLFEILFDAEFPKLKPSWLVSSRETLLELDGYCKPLKLAWEYHGQQHYEFVPHFHESERHFRLRVKDDQIKRIECRKHGIKLIEVPYTVPLRQLESWLRVELEKHGIEPIRKEPVPLSILNAYRPDQRAAMQVIAQSRGGMFLSPEYLGDGQKHRWRCSEGHEWEARPRDIEHSKSWCPTCGAAKRGRKRRLGIEEMRALAKNRGGKCLSTIYVNSQTKIRWRCKKGHEWEAAPSNIKHNGTWCPECHRASVR
jgi:hypothetical protein